MLYNLWCTVLIVLYTAISYTSREWPGGEYNGYTLAHALLVAH